MGANGTKSGTKCKSVCTTTSGVVTEPYHKAELASWVLWQEEPETNNVAPVENGCTHRAAVPSIFFHLRFPHCLIASASVASGKAHTTMRRIPLTTLFGVDKTADEKKHFETSWLLPPAILAGLRGLIALYIFTTIFFFWGWYGTHGETATIGQSFSFFTWLTYWGIGFYMLFAAIHTAYYARTGHSLLYRWPRALRILHSLLYSSITTYPFLVTIVFWALIFKSPWYTKTFTGWQNVSKQKNIRSDPSEITDISTPPMTKLIALSMQISQHALNSFYALLEITLPTTSPHPWIAIPFLILGLLFYLCVAYITFYTEGFYPYSFLNIGDHGSGLVTGYCFGILAAILVIFLVSWALIWLRCWLTRGRIKRARRDPLRAAGLSVGAGAGDQPGEMKESV